MWSSSPSTKRGREGGRKIKGRRERGRRKKERKKERKKKQEVRGSGALLFYQLPLTAV